jgi:hypothetical protein
MSLVYTPSQPFRPTPGQRVELVWAYREFLRARADALRRRIDVRATALPLAHFRARLSEDLIILWLLYQGHVEHLQPALCESDGPRAPRPVSSMCLLETSSFSLTHAGQVFADRLLADVPTLSEKGDDATAWNAVLFGRLVPRYDVDNRVLALGKHVVKCFRQPSSNQELILAAAEELCWPFWFDNPLPPLPGINPKQRLHDTIKNLNHNQRERWVHFKGDGSGMRVGWELL